MRHRRFRPRARRRGLAGLAMASVGWLACVSAPERHAGSPPATPLVATAQSIRAPATGLVSTTLAASGGDGSAVTFALAAAPGLGTATLLDAAAGTAHYVTAGAPLGGDAFTFVAIQNGVRSPAATVAVTIAADGIAGSLTYDFVPTACVRQSQSCALDYAHAAPRPIRQAVVRLLDAAQPDAPAGLLARTVSDAGGRYLFAATAAAQVRVDVVAATESPSYRVQDNTRAAAGYVMRSDALAGTTAAPVDLHAAAGGTASVAAARVAAPFAVLDVSLTVAQAFLAARPELTLAPLALNWSPDNRPQCCDLTAGAITTSHWDGRDLYLLGAADIDEDEFDTHVIAHEWGHYFETTQARSDSPGGPHGPGDLLEPRIAFSEGWGNAESAMALYPDALYTDCSGTGQGTGFFLDLDDMDAVDVAPGYFSESSVAGILFELFDPSDPAKGWDRAALGLGPLIDVMRTGHRTTPAATTLFSFIDALKRANPASAAAIDAVVAHRQVDTIVDAYGSQESHDAGIAASLPIYVQATADSTVSLGFSTPTAGTDGAADPTLFNKLGSNRLVRLVGDGRPLNLTASAPVPVRLVLFSGQEPPQASSDGCSQPPCSASLTAVAATAAQIYIVNVQISDPRAERTTCTLAISH